jgi:hypothetical protein
VGGGGGGGWRIGWSFVGAPAVSEGEGPDLRRSEQGPRTAGEDERQVAQGAVERARNEEGRRRRRLRSGHGGGLQTQIGTADWPHSTVKGVLDD